MAQMVSIWEKSSPVITKKNKRVFINKRRRYDWRNILTEFDRFINILQMIEWEMNWICQRLAMRLWINFRNSQVNVIILQKNKIIAWNMNN